MLCVGGWTLLAIDQYDELGVQGLIVLMGIGIAASALFFLENLFKDIIAHTDESFRKSQ